MKAKEKKSIHLANWLRPRIERMDFGKADFDRNAPSIDLTLSLREDLPDCIFEAFRFELLVPTGYAPAPGRRAEHPMHFAIAVRLADLDLQLGRWPKALIRLEPAPRETRLSDCHLTALLTLAEEAARFHRPDGTLHDWREEVEGLRLRHAGDADRHFNLRNPLYAPLDIRPFKTGLPTSGKHEPSLEELMDMAGDAFSEPVEEFDLDQAIVLSA